MDNTEYKTAYTVVTDSEEINNDPESRTYLLLLNYTGDSGIDKTYEIVTGRMGAYYALRERLDDLILTKSYVLVTGAKLEEMATVYKFLRYCSDIFPDRNFILDNYLKGDEEDPIPEDDDEDEEETAQEETNPINEEIAKEYQKSIVEAQKLVLSNVGLE